MKKVFSLSCLLFFIFSCISIFAGDVKKEEKAFNDGITADIFYPVQKEKLPVLFFAHNGKENKEKWGDYPESLSRKGFLVISIGYTEFAGFSDINDAIKAVRKNYASVGDFKKITLIGGCHGGAKFIRMIGSGKESAINPAEIKTIVLLSLSEKTYLPEPHAPVLVFYSTEDRLGPGYQKGNKTIAEEVISEPKKVSAVEGTPHGNDLVTDDKTRNEVRGKIDAWIADNSR